MRKIVACVIIVTTGLLVAGCNSNDSTRGASKSATSPVELKTQTPKDGVRRITVTELKAAVDKGAVLIVDVRAPEHYATEHIKGSVNIPEPSTDSRSGEFPRDKLIAFYCS